MAENYVVHHVDESGGHSNEDGKKDTPAIVQEAPVDVEGLPAIETTEFISSKVIAGALACFMGAKAVGVKNAALRRNYTIIINIIGATQGASWLPVLYGFGFNWPQTFIMVLLPLLNYPITTRDECRVYESPLLISALRKEKYKRQFPSTGEAVVSSILMVVVQYALAYVFCIFPYVFGGQAATSDTDMESLVVSTYVGMLALLIIIPFNTVVGPMFKLNEIHMEELQTRSRVYAKDVFAILVEEETGSAETMVALGKLHRTERAFLARELKMRSRLLSTNFLFTIPLLLVGIAICTLEPLDHGRASTLGTGRVAIKYLFGAQNVVFAFLVAKAYVGDASKIFKAYRDEIERHFHNPQVLQLVVEKKFNGSFSTFESWKRSNRLALRIYGKAVDETFATEIVAGFTSVISVAVVYAARRLELY